MKLTDARVVSNELDEGLQALHRIAMEASDDMASEWAQAVLTELGRLQAVEKRLNDAERWTRGAGEFERSAGQREAVRYVLYGEVPSR